MSKLIIISLLFLPLLASAQYQPEVLWWNTYCDGDASSGNCVKETDDGGFILAGIDNPIGTPYNDAMLTKTDSFGNEIWSHTYGYGGTERFYSVAQTDDGGYALTGNTESYGSGGKDIYVVRTDS